MPKPEIFQPATYSIEELTFMLDHLEETPNVALTGQQLPPGVNPIAIRSALGRFAELDELARVRKMPWVGYEPIRESIERFIAYQAECLKGQALGENRHPSHFQYDSMGIAQRGAIGADASEMVRTELLPNGDRIPFGVQLFGTVRTARKFARGNGATRVVDEIKHDQQKGTLECTICDKVVASYDVERGTRAKNKAMKDARDHCLKARKEQGRHRSILNVPVA